MELSKLRREILQVIEKNCKIELKDLAAMNGVSEAEVANEIANMEKENIICGYHTMINWDSAGEDKVVAMIEVSVVPQRGVGFDKIAERIYNFSEVEAVYLMSGGFDFMVLLKEKTMRDVSTFVAEKLSFIESVRSTSTHFVLRKYKDHGTILVERKEDERMLVTP